MGRWWLWAWCLPLLAGAVTWDDWRGPQGQGHAGDGGWPLTWSETENVAWKTAIPGRGWSTPVLAGDLLWMTTAFETAASKAEAAERTKADTGGQPLNVLSALRLHAVAVHRETGKVVHDVELFDHRNPQWVHRLNSYASPSAVVANGKVFCHFGSFGNAALDAATGKVLWRNNDHQVNHENGPGSSPVAWRDLILVHYDGSDRQFMVALDQTSGKERWRAERSGKMHDNPQFKKAYATPLVTTINGVDQVISPAADWLYAYDPATGRELWKVSYGQLGFSNVARPVSDGRQVYVLTGFMRSTMICVRPAPDNASAEIVWQQNRSMPKMSSPILVDGLLYAVNDGGIASCLDPATGDAKWRERLGGDFSASPVYGNGHLLMPARDGRVVVLKPGANFLKVRENALPGRLFASPVPIGDSLYLRTDKALYCIR